jgi:flagellin-like protein
MRPVRRNVRAISEIVGALMLVLIVVVAATTLAVFVAQYQKQLQSEQALQHDRELENLVILHASPTLAPGNTTWASLNFTVASLYVNPSTLDEITINDQAVKQYTAYELNLTSGSFESVVVAPGGQLTLAPRQQINVVIDFNNSSSGYSFYNGSFVLHTTDYVKIDLFTALLNDFTRAFIPPTAIAVVTPLETFNGTGYVTVPVLDGSNSFQSGNASLDAWAWSVFPDNVTALGEKAVVTFDPAFHVHHITLIVTDTDGMMGSDTIEYDS